MIIPPFDGRKYKDVIHRYPSWMVFGDSLRGFFKELSKDLFMAEDYHRGTHMNSFLPTMNGAAPATIYLSNIDLPVISISGVYSDPISGAIGITRVYEKNELFTSPPTRVSFVRLDDISGEIPPASGEALCYAQGSALSGLYYYSKVGDPSLYLLNENYEIVASGEFSRRHVSEALEFIPVTGEWYRAMLSHEPDTDVSFFDIYNPEVRVELDQSGTHVEASRDMISHAGRIRAQYSYRDFDSIHRITTETMSWNIGTQIVDPVMVIEHSDPIPVRVPIQFALTPPSGTVLLAIDCADLRPGECAIVDFSYHAHVYHVEPSSGIYQYPSDSADEDSLRIFSAGGLGQPIYYNAATGNVYGNHVTGTVELHRIMNEYKTELGDGLFTVYNENVAGAGPFYVIYSEWRTKRYHIFADQSYVACVTPEAPNYAMDYTMIDETLIPKSVLSISDSDSELQSLLLSAPLSDFQVSVIRGRKGICYDNELGNIWILQDNDILLALNRKYYIQSSDGAYTYLRSDVPLDGWAKINSHWYRRVKLMDFEEPDQAYLLRSMVLYDEYVAILGERNSEYFIIFCSRFDPAQVTVVPVVGSTLIP